MKQDSQLALAVHLPDDETFDSYYGETNKAAAKQLQKFISQKDLDSENIRSFYLFGLAGVGKSHLLHACSLMASQYQLSSVCISFGELIGMPTEVLDGLESIDIICLDDIDAVAGNTEWEQAIFDLFNRVIEQRKKIIISGNEGAKLLNITLPDLVSRLTWGYTEQLKRFSDEEKMSAFRLRAQQRGMNLQDEAVKFLFNHYSRDMTGLIDCLETLDKVSIREQRKITIPFIKEVLL